MSDQLKIGKLITEDVQRDAVHVAIAPVRCCNPNGLSPGEHVGFANPNDYEGVTDEVFTKIGIIDPFLEKDVQFGERCYVFLYPNSITGLNHVWTHRLFPAVTPKAMSSASERWLRELADDQRMGYEELLAGIDRGEVCTGSTDCYDINREEVARHYENVTGVKVGAPRFRCAC